jgi:hypothetical protein
MDFEIIQQKIQNFIKKVSSREDIFFVWDKLQVSDALFCAQDTLRNRKFYEAIGRAIHDIQTGTGTQVPVAIQVIDAWAGIGVLGIFALLQGATRVTFIEENAVSAELLRHFLEDLWLLEKSEIICADVLSLESFPTADILLSETIAIDFESEDFHRIVSHIRPFLAPWAIIIPESFEIFLWDEQQHICVQENIWELALWENFAADSGLLQGRCYLYKDIHIDSGDCMSFFNAREL